MKHNQVCYYVERGFNGGLYVSYGMYEHESMYGGHTVSRLRPPEIRLINGIPFEEFQSETEFKKLPKGWTYSTDLYTVTENIEKKAKINAAMKGRYVTCPSDLQWLFDNGYLVKMENVEPIIEPEFDHDTYRLRKKYPAWTQCYGSHNDRYPDEVFETYEAAEKRMYEIMEENYKRSVECALLDFYEDLEWVLEKYEAEHGGREIAKIKQSILERPHLEDIMFRYYKGEILTVSREAHRKNTHIEWEKIA